MELELEFCCCCCSCCPRPRVADFDGLRGLEEATAEFLARCTVRERRPRVWIPAAPVLLFTLRTSMHCWQEHG